MATGTMKLVDGNTETWECRVCGHSQVITSELGVFPSKGYSCPNGCKFKVEREFFKPWDVRLLKSEPAQRTRTVSKTKSLKPGNVVKAELFPHGKVYLMYPDCEIPTAFNVDAVEGVDYEEIDA
jgi:hypothetical protein